MKIKKGYLITTIIFLLFIILAYKIRHRPIDNLNSLLEENYPKVETKEAAHACDQIKIQVSELFKFVLHNRPDSISEVLKFAKSKNLDIMYLSLNETCKRYHVINADTLKIKQYCEKSMYYAIDLKLKYLGFPEQWKKRNFIGKYFYFNF